MIQFDSIAGFQVVRLLGEGGMGRVYEALQTEPVRRRVALKVLRAGAPISDGATRFAAERQALALMDHPGIAKVFDAGTTEDGHQWFAMELVAGEPLTEYADHARLDVESRVALFERVCRAVQHAHQKGVIHRDLKPSNVLVGEGDRAPAPKIIDFGVAKAVDLRLTERTLVTQFGAVIGTPAYMSPEQAEGTSLDIDTRADVYSLGVMLYELLVGRLPVDPNDTGYAGFIAYLKQPDTSPPTPQQRFTTLDADMQRVAAASRLTNPARLKERLSGDLGWIVMNALEKERGRRYESAGALATDLERYLRHEPVSARPPGRAYRTRKFIRRNRVAVAAGLAVVLALTAGTAAATVGMLRAEREAEAAGIEAATSQRVSDFLATLFAQADPQQTRGREVSVRDVLDSAAVQIGSQLDGEPMVQARLMRAIGQAYQGMGLYQEARPLLAGALERVGQHGDELEVAGMQHDLGYLLIFLSEFETADSLLLEALTTFARADGHGSDWTTVVVSNLVFNRLRWGQGVAAGDSLLEATRDAQVAGLGEGHHRVALAAYMRCWTLRELGRRIQADSACAVSLDLVRRSMGEDAPQVVYNTLAVGHVNRALGRWPTARDAYRSAASLNTVLHPGGHEETAYALLGTAEAWLGEGVLDSALIYADSGVAVLERRLGPESTELAEGLETRGRVLSELRRFEEAEAVLRRVLAIDSSRIGVSSQRYSTHGSRLGELRLAQGDTDEAVRVQDRMLTIMEGAVPANSPRLAGARERAGIAAAWDGRFDRARSLLGLALEPTEASPEDYPRERIRIGTALAWAEIETGAGSRACERARDTRDLAAEILSEAHWRTAWAEAVLGRCLVRTGARAEGIDRLRTAVGRLSAVRPDGDVHGGRAASWLAEATAAPR